MKRHARYNDKRENNTSSLYDTHGYGLESTGCRRYGQAKRARQATTPPGSGIASILAFLGLFRQSGSQVVHDSLFTKAEHHAVVEYQP